MALSACKQTHVVLEPVSDGGPQVTAISTGNGHTCAIKGGALYCWGRNEDGQLGIGTRMDSPTPVRVGQDSDWTAVATG